MTDQDQLLVSIPLDRISVPTSQRIRASLDPQALTELANSMAQLGQLQPISARPTGENWELIAGARRFEAAKKLGWTHIRAIVTTPDDARARVMTFAENVIREDLSPVEEAAALATMIDMGDPDIDHLSERIGKSRSWIDSRLEILAWPAILQQAVHEKKISPAAARHLAKIPEHCHPESLIEQAASAGISARTAAIWLQQAMSEAPQPGGADAQPRGVGTEGAQYLTTALCFTCRQQQPLAQVTRICVCAQCFQQIAAAVEQQQSQVEKTPPMPTIQRAGPETFATSGPLQPFHVPP